MFCMLKKKKIYSAYASKYNLYHEKKVIILTILNGEGSKAKFKGWWYYRAVKTLLPFLKRITSEVIFFLNCLHSFRTKKQLESHKRRCENKYFCNIIMPSKDNKILECNQYKKSDKALLLFMLILNVRLIDVKTILKIYSQ